MTVIDESHVTLPQVRAMYGGDRARKTNLVEHGFRLAAAMDNRPLKFEEFEMINNQTIYASATPADYELEKSEGIIAEQVIRPTGLLEPVIEVRKSENQIDDLLEEIRIRIEKKERVLVTTLTKRMAEEFSKYLTRFSIKCRYIHSDVDTLERVEILHGLKEGVFDVLIGVNLLTQTAGRASRNIHGLVIMYADKITNSMRRSIDETNRRRKKQKAYNKENGLKPQPLLKKQDSELLSSLNPYKVTGPSTNKNIPTIEYANPEQLKKMISHTKREMERMAKDLNFMEATRLRDELQELTKQLKNKA